MFKPIIPNNLQLSLERLDLKGLNKSLVKNSNTNTNTNNENTTIKEETNVKDFSSESSIRDQNTTKSSIPKMNSIAKIKNFFKKVSNKSPLSNRNVEITVENTNWQEDSK